MKADPFVQLRLLDLQALDSALDRLAHRRRTLPEHAQIAALDEQLAAVRDQLVQAETELSDLQREVKRFENEVDQVRTRRARDEDRLGSGAITDPKQLQDLQHEVQTLTRRQSDLEDAELEVMERVETAQGVRDQLAARRDELLAERAQTEARRDAELADIDAEAERTAAQRAELAPTFPADLLALYEKIRANEGGVGAGAVERGRCGGCRLDLMQNELAALRAAAADDVVRHDECRRILVRTAESGL